MAYFSMPMINFYHIFFSLYISFINKTALLGKLCGRFHQEFSIRGEFGLGVIRFCSSKTSSYNLAGTRLVIRFKFAYF